MDNEKFLTKVSESEYLFNYHNPFADMLGVSDNEYKNYVYKAFDSITQQGSNYLYMYAGISNIEKLIYNEDINKDYNNISITKTSFDYAYHYGDFASGVAMYIFSAMTNEIDEKKREERVKILTLESFYGIEFQKWELAEVGCSIGELFIADAAYNEAAMGFVIDMISIDVASKVLSWQNNASKDPFEIKISNGDTGNEGGNSSGYYQDNAGKWQRPNGQFASNTEVGLPGNSDHYLNRPYVRQETIDVVNANTKVNYKTGQIYDSISRKWVDPSNVELGHTSGNEFAYYRNWAESQGMTQSQFNDFMNNPSFYAWQDIYSNRSHMFETKH